MSFTTVFTIPLEYALKAGTFGADPLPDARHLLAPLPFSPVVALPPSGPDAVTDFIAVVRRGDGSDFARWSSEDLAFAEDIWGGVQTRVLLGLPNLWAGRTLSDNSVAYWRPLHRMFPNGERLTNLVLAWPLTGLIGETVEEGAREIARNLHLAAHRCAVRNWTLRADETPEAAARRALGLVALKARFTRSVEMRLVPQNKPFFAQQVWRTAYALGMEWTRLHGNENRARFAWPPTGAAMGQGLFYVGVNEAHGILSPESAARNETIPGLMFWYELPTAPAPIETFDRMALALNYFAQTLGGRPITATGDELDGDRLDALRDELGETVSEMARLGLAPGSPEAARFF